MLARRTTPDMPSVRGKGNALKSASLAEDDSAVAEGSVPWSLQGGMVYPGGPRHTT